MLSSIKHSLLHNYFKFWFQFVSNLFKWSESHNFSRSKNKLYITSHHVPGLCLTQMYSIPSQKVDLHSLLDLICPSFSKILQSIAKLLDRTCRLTCTPSVKKFSLWSNCMKYKRKVLWRTTKLKDKAIWISFLEYINFKISLQIKSSRASNRTSDLFITNTARISMCVHKIKQ